jgi:hypothetical protein
MANIITDLSGDKVVRMTNARFARMPIASIFSGWTTLRVAVYCKMNDSGADVGGTPRFAFGLCSGTSNIPGDATCTHFCGVMTGLVTWTRSTAAVRYSMTNGWYPAKVVGTTFSFGASNFSNSSNTTFHTTAPQLLFIDITKGSPNYSFKMFYYSGGATAPTPSQSDFLAQSVAGSPAFTNHVYSGSAITLAVDEATNGTFDAACVWWSPTNPTADIYAWRVYRVA